MKIWLLTAKKHAKEWEFLYDTSLGHVVRAESETEARHLASKKSGDEGKDAWLRSDKSTCTELNGEGKAECILTDFVSS